MHARNLLLGMLALGALGGCGDDTTTSQAASSTTTGGGGGGPTTGAVTTTASGAGGSTASSGGGGTTTGGSSSSGSSSGGSGGSGGAAAYQPCTSVSELADSQGLTDAMRQNVGSWSAPPGAQTPGVDFTQFTGPFGVHPYTYAAGDEDTEGYGFPGINWGQLRRIYVEAGKFVALQFRVPSAPEWEGKIGGWLTLPGNAYYRFAMAPCPGQFADDPVHRIPSPACLPTTAEESTYWQIGTDEGRCTLEPGQIYYMNMIHAQPPALTTSTCEMATCSTNFTYLLVPGWPEAP